MPVIQENNCIFKGGSGGELKKEQDYGKEELHTPLTKITEGSDFNWQGGGPYNEKRDGQEKNEN